MKRPLAWIPIACAVALLGWYFVAVVIDPFEPHVTVYANGGWWDCAKSRGCVSTSETQFYDSEVMPPNWSDAYLASPSPFNRTWVSPPTVGIPVSYLPPDLPNCPEGKFCEAPPFDAFEMVAGPVEGPIDVYVEAVVFDPNLWAPLPACMGWHQVLCRQPKRSGYCDTSAFGMCP